MTEYIIIIEGHLNVNWQSWFPNMKIANLENGTTKISGPVRDQSELHAYIFKIQDLGMTLIGVVRNDIVDQKSVT